MIWISTSLRIVTFAFAHFSLNSLFSCRFNRNRGISVFAFRSTEIASNDDFNLSIQIATVDDIDRENPKINHDEKFLRLRISCIFFFHFYELHNRTTKIVAKNCINRFSIITSFVRKITKWEGNSRQKPLNVIQRQNTWHRMSQHFHWRTNEKRTSKRSQRIWQYSFSGINLFHSNKKIEFVGRKNRWHFDRKRNKNEVNKEELKIARRKKRGKTVTSFVISSIFRIFFDIISVLFEH